MQANIPAIVSTDWNANSEDAVPGLCTQNNVPWVFDPPPSSVKRIEDVVMMACQVLENERKLPAVLHILQPTSPFVQVETLRTMTKILQNIDDARTAQSFVNVPHCFHALNQRVFNGQGVIDLIDFKDPVKRRMQPKKQDKAPVYAFGGVVSIRPALFMSHPDLWQQPSYGYCVPWWEGLDIDTEDDLKRTNAFINGGLIPCA